MKTFINIMFGLFLISLSSTTRAEEKTFDCSILKGETFIERTCHEPKVTGTHQVKGLPQHLAEKLELNHLQKAKQEGKAVVFNEQDSVTSFIPPATLHEKWWVEFKDNEFTVKAENNRIISTEPIPLIFIMVILASGLGFMGSSKLSLIRRLSGISILTGIAIGTTISSKFPGLLAIAFLLLPLISLMLKVSDTNSGDSWLWFIPMVFIAIFGFTAGDIARKDGFLSSSAMQWIGFCLYLIAMEYGTVFYRRYREKKEKTKEAILAET